MEKNCTNCILSKWVEDNLRKRMRRRCMPNNMWVNRHMYCEEWKSSKQEQFVGAISVSGITTEKKR